MACAAATSVQIHRFRAHTVIWPAAPLQPLHPHHAAGYPQIYRSILQLWPPLHPYHAAGYPQIYRSILQSYGHRCTPIILLATLPATGSCSGLWLTPRTPPRAVPPNPRCCLAPAAAAGFSSGGLSPSLKPRSRGEAERRNRVATLLDVRDEGGVGIAQRTAHSVHHALDFGAPAGRGCVPQLYCLLDDLTGLKAGGTGVAQRLRCVGEVWNMVKQARQ